MPTLRYIAAALCLGWIAVAVSENLFWTVPPPGVTAPGLVVTWLVYALAAAAGLSAVLMTGASGLRAAFLGGAVLGYAVEGALVGTIYEAFPFQLVWTPLAWHALLSGGLYVGLARTPLRPGAAVAVWSGAALLALAVALYWPTERAALPGRGTLALYLVLPMALAVLAHRALDRLLPLDLPTRGVLLAAPALLVAVWAVGTVRDPSVLRLALWPCLALVLWGLARRASGAVWGGHLPPWQAALPLFPPVAVTLFAPPLWAALGPQATNVVVALTTGPVALGLLLWAACRRPAA
ncbi:MAG: hypothetical protein V2J16_10990 [Thermoleophilia bacterium]|jgi:hypothetical protein|nr:hypothetical protein [Thermoleophilia bacterium]